MKAITIRLRDDAYLELKRRARASNRTISSLVVTAALRYARESDFVSDREMAGVLADDALARRLRRGAREAKARSGRLVG